jgi:hypothetical protein
LRVRLRVDMVSPREDSTWVGRGVDSNESGGFLLVLIQENMLAISFGCAHIPGVPKDKKAPADALAASPPGLPPAAGLFLASSLASRVARRA